MDDDDAREKKKKKSNVQAEQAKTIKEKRNEIFAHLHFKFPPNTCLPKHDGERETAKRGSEAKRQSPPGNRTHKERKKEKRKCRFDRPSITNH